MKNKDLILRNMISMEKKDDLMIAKLKDGNEQAYLVEPFIKDIDSCLAKLKDYDLCSLVVYNTKENLDIVIKGWDKLIAKRQLSMHFVNPFSKTEKRWAVYPATHELITDRSHLRHSLNVLFSTVEPTTKEEIEKVISK